MLSVHSEFQGWIQLVYRKSSLLEAEWWPDDRVPEPFVYWVGRKFIEFLLEHCTEKFKQTLWPTQVKLSVKFSCLVVLTLCDPMDCSMPGLPVHHQLLEFTQTYVHWVSDAIQPSHPLLSPSASAQSFSLMQLFAAPWASASTGSSVNGISQARILEWIAIFYFRRSSQTRDGAHISYVSFI